MIQESTLVAVNPFVPSVIASLPFGAVPAEKTRAYWSSAVPVWSVWWTNVPVEAPASHEIAVASAIVDATFVPHPPQNTVEFVRSVISGIDIAVSHVDKTP